MYKGFCAFIQISSLASKPCNISCLVAIYVTEDHKLGGKHAYNDRLLFCNMDSLCPVHGDTDSGCAHNNTFVRSGMFPYALEYFDKHDCKMLVGICHKIPTGTVYLDCE